MKLLIVSHRFPWPLHRGGDTLTVYKMAEFFGRRHQVDLVCHEPESPEDRARVEPLVRSLSTVPFSKGRAIGRVLRGVVGKWPFQVSWCSSPELIGEARRLAVERRHDVGLAYYLRPAEAVRSLPVGLRVAALQLSLALQWERGSRHASNPFTAFLRRVEARRLRDYESEILRVFDRCLLISPRDAEFVPGEQRGKVIYNPHGVDHRKFAPAAGEERSDLIFTGRLSFQPNEDAVLYFAQHILPLIRRSRPDVRLRVVGRDPGRRVRSLHGRDGVEIVGFVPSMVEPLVQARVSVNPLRIGAGLQNKVLEALSCATPVVMSSVANEGIGAPESCCSIADDPESFSHAVLELLESDETWGRKSRAARDFIEREWTWESHFERLEANLQEALSTRASKG